MFNTIYKLDHPSAVATTTHPLHENPGKPRVRRDTLWHATGVNLTRSPLFEGFIRKLSYLPQIRRFLILFSLRFRLNLRNRIRIWFWIPHFAYFYSMKLTARNALSVIIIDSSWVSHRMGRWEMFLKGCLKRGYEIQFKWNGLLGEMSEEWQKCSTGRRVKGTSKTCSNPYAAHQYTKANPKAAPIFITRPIGTSTV